MKTPINFYTQNGWAGSNYDCNLSTREIAAKVRTYAKNKYPDFKFSIRYKWSLYADTLYIELKSGTCKPFVEGSISAQRNYMSTVSNIKEWTDELTTEVFAILDDVTTYANSFRYNDSDGMIDYFDTNFYLDISISKEYKIIDPRAKKTKESKQNITEKTKYANAEGLEIVNYSEKAIAVFGDTKAVKEQLKELGGRFNLYLSYKDGKRAGWIFSKRQADKVKTLITYNL